MGYTHYFEQKKPLDTATWDKLTTDVKKLISVMEGTYRIKLESDDPNGIMVDNTRINFNGADQSHETFYLPKSDTDFNFCKTARKPYDLAVCCALLLAHHHAPDSYKIDSDGDAKEWSEAMNVNAEVFGYAYLLPPSLKYADREGYAIEKAESLENSAKRTADQHHSKDDGMIDIVFTKPSRYRL